MSGVAPPVFLDAQWCTTLPVLGPVEGSETLSFYESLGFAPDPTRKQTPADATDSSGSSEEVYLRSGGAAISLRSISFHEPGDGPVVRFEVADVEAVRAVVERKFPSWVHPACAETGPVMRPHGLQWTALGAETETCIWFVQQQDYDEQQQQQEQ